MTQCIAPSIPSPFEDGQTEGRRAPTLPGILGCQGHTIHQFQPTPQGDKSLFSPELLNCILADLHGAHHGTDRMQVQVREAVYWPGIDADIADYVCWCNICTKPLPLYSLCYLGISLMAPGRRLQLITSPIRVESTC